jgi:hypothetical protein
MISYRKKDTNRNNKRRKKENKENMEPNINDKKSKESFIRE